MSGSTTQPQASQNFNRQLAEDTAAINQKVDGLALALGGLTIGDDLKQHIDQQMAEIREQVQQEINKIATARKEFKTKDIEPYDGESQPLRSFLTAIELRMENQGIEGDEKKVRYVGGYLRKKAWEWFEPIIRERNEKCRSEWSDRATRILGDYKEMKKAMGQVFGDIDERRNCRTWSTPIS